MGIYIHIPFCRSRCIYCDFYSTTLGLEVMASYLKAVEREIVHRRQQIEGAHSNINTIYIGGGTPSLLPIHLLNQLFKIICQNFTLEEDAEVTIEANPDDVTTEWLTGLTETPVNRISMGTQTFNDKLLSFIGRRHNCQQTIDAVKACKEAGFNNISLDLIYGLPGQSFEIWEKDVKHALSLGINHLSAYALSYEEGTKLNAMLRQKLVEEADEELSRQMYNHLMSETNKAGYYHYEISNFALPGYQSRHNSSYWQGVPYLGIGAGAHSYDGKQTRRANHPDIKAYIVATGDVPHEIETLNNESLYNEFIMTRLRTSAGIPLNELPTDDRHHCLSCAEPHLRRHLLHIKKGKHLCLTKEGIFVSNDIISDLMK